MAEINPLVVTDEGDLIALDAKISFDDNALFRHKSFLQEAGLSFARRVSYGRRAEEIVDFAAEEDSDLIILSSHRIDLENPGSSWTTLSYKVAILAQCPVLLVK